MHPAADWIAWVSLRAAETLLRALPPAFALRLAHPLGLAWFLSDRRRRRRAWSNVCAAFPEATRVERRHLVRAAFVAMARVPLESLFAPRLLPTREALERRVELHGDREALLRCLAEGRPGVLLGGHLGNWEICARALGLQHASLKLVTKRNAGGRVFDHLQRSRGGPQAVIDRRGAVAKGLGALRRGWWVGFLADQNAGRGGAFVPFFGIPASTHAAPVWLASRAGVPLFAGACIRRPGTFRFAMHVRQIPLPPDPGADREALLRALGTAVASLEAWIRLAPEQYNWLHRRWKDRPRGEPPDACVPRYDHHRPPAASALSPAASGSPSAR